jgi:hypothetical protein
MSAQRPPYEQLFQRDQIEIPFGMSEEEFAAVVDANSDDAVFEGWASAAWRFLQDAGVTTGVLSEQTRRTLEKRDLAVPDAAAVPALLLTATVDRPDLYAAARVVYHWVQHLKAMRAGQVHAVRHHTARMVSYADQV